MMPLIIIAIIFVLFLTKGLYQASIRSRQLSLCTWQETARRIRPVHNEAIRAVAKNFLDPSLSATERDPKDIWDSLGGAEGFARMNENAEVLISLASYAQQWDPNGGAIIQERMKRDGVALRRAVLNLSVALTCHSREDRALAYVHEAASSYHLMRERLLALYKNNHAGVYPLLQELI